MANDTNRPHNAPPCDCLSCVRGRRDAERMRQDPAYGPCRNAVALEVGERKAVESARSWWVVVAVLTAAAAGMAWGMLCRGPEVADLLRGVLP